MEAELSAELKAADLIADRSGGERTGLEGEVVDEPDLPESIRSMVAHKIDQLSDADRQVLSVASVQGNDFVSAVVARASGVDPGEVEQRLERLGRLSTADLRALSQSPPVFINSRLFTTIIIF